MVRCYVCEKETNKNQKYTRAYDEDEDKFIKKPRLMYCSNKCCLVIKKMAKFCLTREQVIALTTKCQVCGWPHVTKIHHKIFVSKGGKDEFENYIGLCSNCHDYIHFKKDDFDELRDEVKKFQTKRKKL